jgi:hypothetical protein
MAKVRQITIRKGGFFPNKTKVTTELTQWISKRPGRSCAYLQELHRLYLSQNKEVMNLAYTVGFTAIVVELQHCGYKKTERQVWLDLLDMYRKKGFSHEWNNKEKPVRGGVLLLLPDEWKETVDKLLVRLYHRIPFAPGEPKSHNATAYTEKFDKMYAEVKKLLQKEVREGLFTMPSKNEVFIMLKNLGREPRKHGDGKTRKRLGPTT